MEEERIGQSRILLTSHQGVILFYDMQNPENIWINA